MERTIIGETIAKLRNERGESQDQLADAIQETRAIVRNWETGKSEVRHPALIKLAEHFGVSVDYLLGLSELQSIQGSCREAAEYTGLSETAIEALHEIKEHFEVGDFDVDGSYIKDEEESSLEAVKLMGVASDLIASESFCMVLSFLDAVGYNVERLKRELERPHDSGNWDRLHDAETELRHAVFDCVECFQDSLDEMYGVRDCKKDAHRAIDAILKSVEKERR